MSANHNDFHRCMGVIFLQMFGWHEKYWMYQNTPTPDIRYVFPYSEMYHSKWERYTPEFVLSSSFNTEYLEHRHHHLNSEVTVGNIPSNLYFSVDGDRSYSVYKEGVFGGNDVRLWEKCMSLGIHVIHLTWKDFDSEWFDYVFRTRVRVPHQTFEIYKQNMMNMNYPFDEHNFILYQDEILNENETHYTDMCSFMNIDPHPNWRNVVRTYTDNLYK